MSIKHLNTIFMISWSVGEIYSFTYFDRPAVNMQAKLCTVSPEQQNSTPLRFFIQYVQTINSRTIFCSESTEEKVIWNGFSWMNEAAQVCNL